eukprot:4311199-Amphidinium_carterae.2
MIFGASHLLCADKSLKTMMLSFEGTSAAAATHMVYRKNVEQDRPWPISQQTEECMTTQYAFSSVQGQSLPVYARLQSQSSGTELKRVGVGKTS